MGITRRKFLKFLSIGIASAAIPATALDLPSVKKALPDPDGYGMAYKWISFEEASAIYPLKCKGIEGDEPLYGLEERLGFDKHPIFRGQLGIFNGVRIHEHK